MHVKLLAASIFSTFQMTAMHLLKKFIIQSVNMHACAQQFFAKLIFTQIKRTGLWKIYRSKVYQ